MKMQDVSSLTPQELGVLTPLYKRLVPYVKASPWKIFAGGSLAVALFLYLLFGVSIIYLVSLLQQGF